MSILKKASNQMAFSKLGIFGSPGSGKTYTSSCIAIGLHRYAKCKKPIGFFDTEGALSYVLPLFESAGIEVLKCDSRSFKDLKVFMKEAEQTCSIAIVDSISHPWLDLQKCYLDKLNEGRKGRPLNKIEFHHWGKIKEIWNEFADHQYLYSKLHVILCGREASIYEYQINDETQKKELITTDSRMATEKGLGYQPSLLIQMSALDNDGKISNTAYVKKDRSFTLHGDEITFPAQKGVNIDHIYKVFDSFMPHFQRLNLNGNHFESLNNGNTKDIIPEYESDQWPREQNQRMILSEEIQGLLVKHHPGQTAEEKKIKGDLIERFLNTRSWTKIEKETPSQKLREALHNMRVFLEGDEEKKDTIEQFQADKLKDLLKDDPARLAATLEWAAVKTVEEMPLSFYNAAMDNLRAEQGQETTENSKKKVA